MSKNKQEGLGMDDVMMNRIDGCDISQHYKAMKEKFANPVGSGMGKIISNDADWQKNMMMNNTYAGQSGQLLSQDFYTEEERYEMMDYLSNGIGTFDEYCELKKKRIENLQNKFSSQVSLLDKVKERISLYENLIKGEQDMVINLKKIVAQIGTKNIGDYSLEELRQLMAKL